MSHDDPFREKTPTFTAADVVGDEMLLRVLEMLKDIRRVIREAIATQQAHDRRMAGIEQRVASIGVGHDGMAVTLDIIGKTHRRRLLVSYAVAGLLAGGLVVSALLR